MRRSATSSSAAPALLALGLFVGFTLSAPGCGGSVADDAGASGSGPNVVAGGASGSAGSTGGTDADAGAGGTASGGKGGTNGGKGGTSSGKGGTSSGKGGAPGDLFDLEVPDDAKPCYECAKSECQAQLEQCNEDPTCVEVATCLLDQCATDQSTQCALGCLDGAGVSVTDFNNPVVQTALGIGQCVQGGCADQCQVPGAGGGAGTGAGGNTSGGNGGSTSQSCSAFACGQACGQVGFACAQDNDCKACLQDPSAAGCATNQAFQASKMCCNANAGVCTGCMGCAALIDTGSGGTGGSAGAGGSAAAGAAGAGAAGAGAAAGATSGGAAGTTSGGAAGESAGGAAGESAGTAGSAGASAAAGAAGNP
jgi:hypothetical protein